MNSTRGQSAATFPYLGVDLSSRYGAQPRPVDVCGLSVGAGGTLRPEFWQWSWQPAQEPLDVSAIVDELRRARSVMVDGPQALAAHGRRLRTSERLCRAPGKTPDTAPAHDVPYGAFICSAIEWFAAIDAAGLRISPPGGVGGACEFYPGEGWVRLSQRRLPIKTSAVGRKVRLDLLRRWGVQLPRGAMPNHDALDACLGALMAAAADGAIKGLAVEAVGLALQRGRDGVLREGPIMLPRLLELR